jgi:multiple sugar transport system substrate-binding protein
MKKLIKMLAICLSLLMMVTGCQSNDTTETTEPTAETNEPTEIIFMNYSSSGANEETLIEMVNAFEAKNPDVMVDLQTYGYDDYFQQLATKIAGDTTPDVFELNIENFRAYANKGVLAKIEGVDVSEIHPKALEAFTIDNEQFGLPTKFSNVVMIYNKELFDAAGVDYPTSDWTWDDELAAAMTISDMGDDYFGVFRPIQTWEFYKTVEQNGGSMMNAAQTEFTLNSVENAEALEMMIDRVNKYNVTPNADQMGGMGDWDLFKSGRLGMIVTGIWAFPDFTENCDFDWDIVVEPGITEKATHFFSDAVVVSSKSEENEAATRFAAFISGSQETAEIRLDANWDLPVALTDEVTTKYLSVTPPENKQAVIDSLNYLVMPPSLEQFSAIADVLGEYLNQALAGNLTAQEALDQAQEDITTQFPIE